MFKRLIARVIFYYRFKFNLFKRLRTFIWVLLGMKVGKNTYIPKRIFVTWPHKVKIGDNCKFEHSIYFHYDGIYSLDRSILIGNNVFIGNNTEFNISDKVSIGNDCLIAAGCQFVDHNHKMNPGQLMRLQKATLKEIVLEDDVWLGCNVIILMGVNIGKGSIVAAGAVVTKNIPPFEIWGGVPAKRISFRK